MPSNEQHSYLEMAYALAQHGAAPNEDMAELWRRIVFTIMISNTDDHLRNHAGSLENFFIYWGKLSMQILLASSSSRRRVLLTALGFDVLVMSPNVDESQLNGEKPEDMVCRLARLKANSVFAQAAKDIPIIAADTVVRLEDRIFGKPKDEQDAIKMLSLLSGKEHEVITGFTVKQPQEEKTGFVKTRVFLRDRSKEEILSYVKTGEPLDKAGAYALQGIGACLIDKVVGSYTSVIGLPIKEVLAAL